MDLYFIIVGLVSGFLLLGLDDAIEIKSSVGWCSFIGACSRAICYLLHHGQIIMKIVIGRSCVADGMAFLSCV